MHYTVFYYIASIYYIVDIALSVCQSICILLLHFTDIAVFLPIMVNKRL